MHAEQITTSIILTILLVAGFDIGLAFLMRGEREGAADGRDRD